MKDPKTWLFAFMNGGIGLAVGAIGSFLPTFIEEFGYSKRQYIHAVSKCTFKRLC